MVLRNTSLTCLRSACQHAGRSESGRRGDSSVTKIYFALAFALGAAATAAADPLGTANPKPVVAETLAGFQQQAAEVRAGMQPGGVYGYIEASDRTRVEQRLDAMQQILERRSGDAALPQNDKLALLNTQEELNAILLKNDNNRLECERGTHTGSRIHVTTCRTHGEIVKRERDDRDALGDALRQPQTQKPSKDH